MPLDCSSSRGGSWTLPGAASTPTKSLGSPGPNPYPGAREGQWARPPFGEAAAASSVPCVRLKVQLLRGLWEERGLQAREAAVGAASRGASSRGRAHPGPSLLRVGLLFSRGQESCHGWGPSETKPFAPEPGWCRPKAATCLNMPLEYHISQDPRA